MDTFHPDEERPSLSVAETLDGYRGAKAASAVLLAGAKTTHENAFKLPLVGRTLGSVLTEARA